MKMDNFYQEHSKKFKKYSWQSQGKLIKGENPNFFKLLKKYSDKNLRALDLGCGSGELTLKISPYFKEIIGIDPFKNYLKTAKQEKDTKNIKNVKFQVADAKELPFKNNFFDIIYSSRGPLSADIDFMNEGYRVLKDNGLMIEETIGETDKIELKNIFNRGQNYPIKKAKLESVKSLLDQLDMNLIESQYFLFYKIYPSIKEVVEILERAPIIPNFNKTKDKLYLEDINKKLNNNGIELSTHKLHWVAKK
mgnify:FL=1|jgi:ubiquinone/menaquinone biosynthesis C-methylase UbiE